MTNDADCVDLVILVACLLESSVLMVWTWWSCGIYRGTLRLHSVFAGAVRAG